MNRPCVLTLLAVLPAQALAGDWTAWGRTGERNMVADERKAPKTFGPGEFVDGTETVDMDTTDGVRWVAKLGSQTYGNPTVADGMVFVGTNNAMEFRKGLAGDKSIVLALDEATGERKWQLTVPKLGAGKVNDWEYLGICSSPTVVGDVVYVVTNRGEAMALDVKGLSDGNDGPFQSEGDYMTGPGVPAVELDPSIDADILWAYDMPNELGVFPHNVTSSSVLVVGDKLYVTTSNGVDWSHLDLPSPFSPSLIVLDRHTGELIGEEISGISEDTMHANWSSPTFAPGQGDTPDQVVFGAGDGKLYGFDVDPVDDDGLPVLHERWSFDGNDPAYRWKDGEEGGEEIKYATYDGPSEYIASPVHVDGVVYAGIGQDPEHGPGVGRLSAVRVDGEGDVTDTHAVWTYDDLTRTISTVAVSRRIVFAADYDGRLHAVDARTGEPLWVYETGAHIWGSPMVAGNKVYLGDEDGVLHVLKAGRKLKVFDTIQMSAPIYSTPILANGVLYIATQTHLFAVDGQ